MTTGILGTKFQIGEMSCQKLSHDVFSHSNLSFLQIMEAFKVAPFDQNLCLNGQYLTDNSKTLGHLRILPKSLIYLRADEPNPGISAIEPDDGWNMQHPEEGFKGMQTFLFSLFNYNVMESFNYLVSFIYI